MKNVFCVLVFVFGITNLVYGQCYPDRHNTNWYDGWVSCEAYPNPNSTHGLSHWILYDFDRPYKLNQMHVWNYNHPDELGKGLKDVVIDYSLDGSTWTSAGTYTFNQASGLSIYEGSEGPDLDGIDARYVLITALDNWGGDACFGLSEVRFEAEDFATTSTEDEIASANCLSMQIYPNPFNDAGRIMVQTSCLGEIRYEIVDVLGRTVDRGSVGGNTGIHDIHINGSQLPPGSYVVSLVQGNQRIQKQMLRVE